MPVSGVRLMPWPVFELINDPVIVKPFIVPLLYIAPDVLELKLVDIIFRLLIMVLAPISNP